MIGYDNAKQRASYLRNRHGLKFDEVRFKKQRVGTGPPGRRTGGQAFRGGRVDIAKNYNPSKRGYYRGLNYSDGYYADLD